LSGPRIPFLKQAHSVQPFTLSRFHAFKQLGNWQRLFVLVNGLPVPYNRDLQDDKVVLIARPTPRQRSVIWFACVRNAAAI
jgi:argininosuccinate lyase